MSCELLLINTQLQNDRFQYLPEIERDFMNFRLGMDSRPC